MRKSLLFASSISFLLMCASFVVRLPSNPAAFAAHVWPWLLCMLTLVSGILFFLVAMVLFVIYWIRQEKAKVQQFKGLDLAVHTYKALLRSKAEVVRPYKREVWLQMICIAGVIIGTIGSTLINLILSFTDTSSDFAQQQQTQGIFDLACWLCVPLCFAIYAFLSEDLRKVEITRERAQ